MKLIVPAGRILYSLMFLNSGMFHFSSAAVAHAETQHVPFATLLVPLSGVMAMVGGLSILLGYKTKVGAWLIIGFLIPVTIMMHGFWHVNDPTEHQMQMTNFFKNTSMLGAAFLIAWFGAGPFSIDESVKAAKDKDRY